MAICNDVKIADDDAVDASADDTLLRQRDDEDHQRVGFIELFFDLVYVFAITQLSHYLLKHLDAIHALQTLVMFMAVWWAWMFTTWATNWVDPDRPAVRLMLALVMLVSLLMSSEIPLAFAGSAKTDGGLIFAAGYVLMQVGRTAWVAWIMRRDSQANARNLARATIWFMVSGAAWIAGALSDDMTMRLLWWAGAILFEYAAPALRFVVPGLGRSSTRDWDVSGAHMAERCALFVIIALGEGILVTGATFSARDLSLANAATFTSAFVGSVAMWWVYFDVGAKRGAEHIENHDDPGRVARDAFTYWHMPIVAGIVTTAVADAISLAHPFEPVDVAFVLSLVGGAMLFLGGTMQFKRISSDKPRLPLSHRVGFALFAVLGAIGLLTRIATLQLSVAAATVFGIVALWEWVSLNGGWLERLQRRGIELPAWLGRRARARLAAAEGLDPRKVL